MRERSPFDRMCEQLASIEAPLDELARARVAARLEAALDAAALAAPVKPPRTRSHRAGIARATLAVAALAALVAAAVVWWSVDDARPRASHWTFEPYIVSASDGASLAAVPFALVAAAPRLEVPAGSTVRATVGRGATVTLVGPAVAEVRDDDGVPRIRLVRGRLLGALDGRAGRTLRIETAQLLATIVGTVFAVDAAPSSRVAVLHGTVVVVDAGSRIELGAGQSWDSDRRSVETVDAVLGGALGEHAAIDPPPEPAVAVTLIGEPVGAEIRIGATRIATTPAWVRLTAGSQLTVAASGYGTTTVAVPAAPATNAPPVQHSIRFALPRTEPAPAPITPSTGNLAPTRREAPAPSAAMRSATAPRAAAPARGEAAPDAEPAVDAASPGVAAPAPRSAAALHQDADRALAAGDRDAARAALLAILARFPADPLADAARYELAVLAHGAGEQTAALRYLAPIADPALAEPVDYLRCRILVTQRSPGAVPCFDGFRRRYPASAHDSEALAELGDLHVRAADCAAARPLLDEYLRRYPDGPEIDEVRARRQRCR